MGFIRKETRLTDAEKGSAKCAIEVGGTIALYNDFEQRIHANDKYFHADDPNSTLTAKSVDGCNRLRLWYEK